MVRKAAIFPAAAITGGAAIGWGSDAAHRKALTNERQQPSEEFALELGETGLLVKVSFDDAEIASDIEIKLIYAFL